MRPWVAASLGLVFGLLAGSIVPSSTIRSLESENAELRRQSRSSVTRDFARMLAQGAASSRSNPEGGTGGPKSDAPEPSDAPPSGEPIVKIERVPETDDLEDFDAAAERGDIGAMQDIMDMRRQQALESLRQTAGADDTQLAEVENVTSEMNAALRNLAEQMVTDLLEYGEPDRRQTLEFAAEGLDIILQADNGIREALTEDQLWALEDAAIDPFSYLDPAIMEVFEGLGDLEEPPE